LVIVSMMSGLHSGPVTAFSALGTFGFGLGQGIIP
jgi:hypothetical protein